MDPEIWKVIAIQIVLSKSIFVHAIPKLSSNQVRKQTSNYQTDRMHLSRIIPPTTTLLHPFTTKLVGD